MKIKLFILSLVAWFSFVWFSSAFDDVFDLSYWAFSPWGFIVDWQTSFNLSLSTAPQSSLLNSDVFYYIDFYWGGSRYDEDFWGCVDWTFLDNVSIPFAQSISVNIPEWTDCVSLAWVVAEVESEDELSNLQNEIDSFSSVVDITFWGLTPPENPNPEEVPWGSSSWSSLLPVWSLTPVITNLWTTVSEFIPYIVYIWVWILGAIIWFVAIRWLINRIRSKTLSPFR